MWGSSGDNGSIWRRWSLCVVYRFLLSCCRDRPQRGLGSLSALSFSAQDTIIVLSATMPARPRKVTSRMSFSGPQNCLFFLPAPSPATTSQTVHHHKCRNKRHMFIKQTTNEFFFLPCPKAYVHAAANCLVLLACLPIQERG